MAGDEDQRERRFCRLYEANFRPVQAYAVNRLDRLGRHGIGVSFTQYGVRDVLIFDPATTAVLEQEGIAVDPAQINMPPGQARFSAGEVINYTVYQASGVVNSIGAVPSAAA